MKAQSQHERIAKRAKGLLVALILLTPLVLLVCLSVGSSSLSFWDVLHPEGASRTILLGIRLPRVLLSFLIGAGLAISGVAMQGLFQNPMADPHLLGVSSGAAFGATIAFVLGLSALTQSLLAFVSSLLTVLIVQALALTQGRVNRMRLLLCGVAATSLLSALVSAIMMFNKQQMDRIMHWTMGSFTSANMASVYLSLALIIPLGIVLLLFARPLNAIALGDEEAQSLGINVRFARGAILMVATFITAAAVSIAGIIGFVGLIVPHAMRMLSGSNHHTLLPISFFAGGLFLTLCDTLARSAASPYEIPVGVVTALIGGMFFLVLMRSNRAINNQNA